MAWITISSVDTRYCYTQFQYDDSSSASNRLCRLIMAAKSGYRVDPLTYWNVTVNGTNYGAVTNVTVGTVIWHGNLPYGDRSFSFTINWYDIGYVFYSGSGYVPGVAVTTRSVLLESYWNSIAVNSTISSWAGNNSHRFETFVIIGSGATTTNVYNYKRACLRTVDSADLQKDEVFDNATIVAGKNQIVLVTGNPAQPYLYRSESWNGWSDSDQIRGCMDFQIGTYAYEDVNWAILGSDIPATVYHTPPAPGTLIAPATVSSTSATISFIGVLANNHTPGDATKLTRSIRYKVNDGSWTYLENDIQKAISDLSTHTIVVPAGSTVTVEAWHSYYGLLSETSTATIRSTLPPTARATLYGSVNGNSEKIEKLYGSVNGASKKIKKLYGSVDGRSKLIYYDNN